MTKADKYLIEDIKNILENGTKDIDPRPKYEDGTPAHTYFVTHRLRTYDLSKDEFPICTLRPMAWKSAIKEMFWIFQDKSNSLKMLQDKYKSHVWDQWESKKYPDTIGTTYGYIIDKYDMFNKRVLNDIKENPYSRYHICNMWQEGIFQSEEMDGLKPCAYETIWSVRGEYLDMLLNQRSGDMLVASGAGGFNEIQYGALLIMVAKHCGYKPGRFSHMVVNEQIYDRHIEQANELIDRYEKKCIEGDEDVPKLILDTEKKDFYEFEIDDFKLENYNPVKPQLKFDIGV